MRAAVWIFPFLTIALGVCAEKLADFSGTWHLNIEKSRWGSKPKPVSVVLEIEHKDPLIKYHGTVADSSENTRDFSFDGAIDGKEYPMAGSIGAGTAIFRRVDSSTIESVSRSADGKSTETTRTYMSRDGKTLTRVITEKAPQGNKTWTEVYDRR